MRSLMNVVGSRFSRLAARFSFIDIFAGDSPEHGRRARQLRPPGFIDTPILGDTDRDKLIASTPMGRLGRAEEMAALIAFVASDDASFATGAEFVAGGGVTAG